MGHLESITGPQDLRRLDDRQLTELAAVRMEDPTVFQDTHRLLMRLVGEGKIQGLRIDHPDGLRDPADYFRRLQESCRLALGSKPSDQF